MDIEGYRQPLFEILEGNTDPLYFTVRSDLHTYISLSTGRKASHILSRI